MTLKNQGRVTDVLGCKYLEKKLEIEARFEGTTNRKWRIASGHMTKIQDGGLSGGLHFWMLSLVIGLFLLFIFFKLLFYFIFLPSVNIITIIIILIIIIIVVVVVVVVVILNTRYYSEVVVDEKAP